jgi:hypothetical protein
LHHPRTTLCLSHVRSERSRQRPRPPEAARSVSGFSELHRDALRVGSWADPRAAPVPRAGSRPSQPARVCRSGRNVFARRPLRGVQPPNADLIFVGSAHRARTTGTGSGTAASPASQPGRRRAHPGGVGSPPKCGPPISKFLAAAASTNLHGWTRARLRAAGRAGRPTAASSLACVRTTTRGASLARRTASGPARGRIRNGLGAPRTSEAPRRRASPRRRRSATRSRRGRPRAGARPVYRKPQERSARATRGG